MQTGRPNPQADRLFREFLDEYGHVCAGPFDGVPCPEQQADPCALTVGHAFGDGNVWRREHNVKGGMTAGNGALTRLKRMGWPKDQGIITQCANCQLRDRRSRMARDLSLSI